MRKQHETDRNCPNYSNPLRRTYQFVDHTIGGPLNFRNQNPQIELELNEIDIAFAQGLFTLYSKGKKLVDFQDDNFKTINYLGIVVLPKRCDIDAIVIVDDFIISGVNLDVQPKSKAAVLWGQLKRQ